MTAAGGGGSIAFSSFAASSSSSSYLSRKTKVNTSAPHLPFKFPPSSTMARKVVSSCRIIACSAVQESSTSTVAAAAETKEKKEVVVAKEAAPAKPKPAGKAKAPAKPLPQMMEEDVIPSLKEILEAQDDISEIELAYRDNRLEGSFLKKGNPYSFWAFFPDGVLTGPKGFSLSSYGSEASSVEPFLVDEKRITARHVVFWVEKRLAAQGIIPVWKD